MKTIIKLTGLSLLTTHAVFAQAAAEAFDMDNYKSQCDASKNKYITALQQARDAYPAYMASLKGYKTVVSVHAKHATSQAYIDESVGLGDWQNLLRSKQKKNLRAWGETEETFHFDLADYTRVYEHSKNIYDVAKTSATKFKKEYLAACQAYEDIQSAYFNSLTEGAVDEEAPAEDNEAAVSWNDWSTFAGNSIYSKQAVLGNFKAGWTVDFPMVDSITLATIQTACNSDQNSADCVLARQSNTFSYNVIDQALTYPTCSYSTFDAIRKNVFSSTIALLNSVGADGAAYTARYGDTKCFDRDIAMQQFDVMDFTFDKLTRLGYRLTIPAGKSCVVARGQIPHFNVYGKNITEINTDLTNINTGESPSWPKRQTTYVLDDRAVGVADWGPGTYDVYVADSQFSIPPDNDAVVQKYASTPSQENIYIMSATDHVVRLTFGVPSDILLDTTTDGLNECSFQIEKIYLNDFTYNMVA